MYYNNINKINWSDIWDAMTYPWTVYIHAIILIDSKTWIQVGKCGDTSRDIEHTGWSFKWDIIIENFIPISVTMTKILPGYCWFIPVYPQLNEMKNISVTYRKIAWSYYVKKLIALLQVINGNSNFL